MPVIFGRTSAVMYLAAANSAYALILHAQTEFGHLEHADLLLATKNHLQRVIGVDHSLLLLVLQLFFRM